MSKTGDGAAKRCEIIGQFHGPYHESAGNSHQLESLGLLAPSPHSSPSVPVLG